MDVPYLLQEIKHLRCKICTWGKCCHPQERLLSGVASAQVFPCLTDCNYSHTPFHFPQAFNVNFSYSELTAKTMKTESVALLISGQKCSIYNSKIPQDWKIWKFLFVDPVEQIDWHPTETTQNLKAMKKKETDDGVTSFSVNPQSHSSVLGGDAGMFGYRGSGPAQSTMVVAPFLWGEAPGERTQYELLGPQLLQMQSRGFAELLSTFYQVVWRFYLWGLVLQVGSQGVIRRGYWENKYLTRASTLFCIYISISK